VATLVNWNTDAFVAMCKRGGMARLVEAAETVRDEAKRILRSKMNTGGITRQPGRYYMIVNGKRVPSPNPPIWMERRPGSMIETIRVVTQPKWPWPEGTQGKLNVWVMAGNYKTWWALQMEYGRGAWKGGQKSFIRPALRKTTNAMRIVLESGAGQAKGYE